MRIDFKPQLLESVEEFLSELDNSIYNQDIELLKKEIKEITQSWEG